VTDAVLRRIACLTVSVLALSVAPAGVAGAAGAPPAAGAASAHWKPIHLARQVVSANLKRTSPGFRVFLGTTTCTGRATVAHCTVKATVSNDDVTAKVSFTRHRDGTHLQYVDKLTFLAAMGGGTVTRTYYGKILT
jgi:hypothetical protein